MKRSLLLIGLLSCLYRSFSQDCQFHISGKVLDIETLEPLPFVTVRVTSQSIGAVTDQNGYFKIEGLCKTEVELEVSYVGYKKVHHHHDVYHEDPTILLAPDNKMLESVIVEGEYNATNIETLKLDELSAGQLQSFQSTNFGQLLDNFTGVSTISTGQNIVKPIIHGLHSNRVLIINNGVRHEFQNWGVEHAPEIDPSQAQSIQVLKGAATVKYGPEALGGVILVNPKPLELSSHLHGQVRTHYATNGKSVGSEVELSKGWNHWAIASTGAINKQGDLNAPDYSLTNTSKNEYSYSFAGKYHQGIFNLEGFYSHFFQNLGILRGSVNGNLDDLAKAIESTTPLYTQGFSYDLNNPRQEVIHDLWKLKASWVMDEQDLQIQYAYQKNHRYEYDVRRGTLRDIPSINLKLNTHSLDFDWNHRPVGKVDGVLGIQSSYQDNNNIPGTNTIPFVPNYNNTRVGVFAIESIHSGTQTYEFGLRYDYLHTSVRGRSIDNSIFRNEFNYSQITGSIGYKNTFTKNADFRSNLGVAWRPPSIAELYSFGKHGFSLEYGSYRYSRAENGDLETVIDLNNQVQQVPEVGLKWVNNLSASRENLHWDLTAYINYIDNFFYTRPSGITNTVRGAFPLFVYSRTDAVFAGIDLGVNQTINDQMEIEWKGSYLFARDLRNDDTFVEVPPLRLSSRATYSLSWFDEAFVFVAPSYSFKYWQQPKTISVQSIIDQTVSEENLVDNFDFVDAPDAYFLLYVGWEASQGHFKWMIRVNNLLNTKYRAPTDRLRYFADQVGRNIQVSLTYLIH